jgi:hypothetical protein
MTTLSSILDLMPWWSPWASALLTALGVLLRFRWLLALIPGAGPILLWCADGVVRGIGVIAAKVLLPYLKQLGIGVFKALTTAHGLAVTVTGAMVFILVGITIGVRLDAHLVKTANAERLKVEQQLAAARMENEQWKGRLDDQEKRAADALEARKKAEADAKARARRAAAERAKRLRDGTGAGAEKAGPQKAAGPGLLGLPALFGGGS